MLTNHQIAMAAIAAIKAILSESKNQKNENDRAEYLASAETMCIGLDRYIRATNQ